MHTCAPLPGGDQGAPALISCACFAFHNYTGCGILLETLLLSSADDVRQRQSPHWPPSPWALLWQHTGDWFEDSLPVQQPVLMMCHHAPCTPWALYWRLDHPGRTAMVGEEVLVAAAGAVDHVEECNVYRGVQCLQRLYKKRPQCLARLVCGRICDAAGSLSGGTVDM